MDAEKTVVTVSYRSALFHLRPPEGRYGRSPSRPCVYRQPVHERRVVLSSVAREDEKARTTDSETSRMLEEPLSRRQGVTMRFQTQSMAPTLTPMRDTFAATLAEHVGPSTREGL